LRACLAALSLLLLGTCPAFASLFDQVPQGDQAYSDCHYLAECGIIDARPADDFAGAKPLARYDFTLSLVRPMAALEALAQEGRTGLALSAVGRMSADERARVGKTLARLLEEFGDVLSALGKDSSKALLGARLLADGGYTPRAAGPPADGMVGINYEAGGIRVGVAFGAAEGEAASLPPVPLGGLADAPITGLAASRSSASRAVPDFTGSPTLASGEISLRRLRGAVEYGLTDNLSLGVAYESMVREGKDAAVLDRASLRTVGVGYRFSPSTSLNLRYHLIDYSDRTRLGARLEDRMAETELTVRF